jgi:hypothetical protein
MFFADGMEDFAGGSTVLPPLCEAFEFKLSDFEADNAKLNGDYLQEVVKIVIGGVPIVLEVRFMCLFMSLSRILLQGSISKNLFNPLRHQVDSRKVEAGIDHFRNIYLLADIIPPGIHFALIDGRRPRFSIHFLVHLQLLHEFRAQGIGFGLRLFARLPA